MQALSKETILLPKSSDHHKLQDVADVKQCHCKQWMGGCLFSLQVLLLVCVLYAIHVVIVLFILFHCSHSSKLFLYIINKRKKRGVDCYHFVVYALCSNPLTQKIKEQRRQQCSIERMKVPQRHCSRHSLPHFTNSVLSLWIDLTNLLQYSIAVYFTVFHLCSDLWQLYIR